ncbi:hypothetical protein EAF00_002576 [Botryotinia globosa]|nr:hypothetical protein EAF00_002576 [Botryotinia globosa]
MAFIHDTISRYHKVNSVSAVEKIKLALLRCNNFVKTHTFWPGNSDQNDFGDDRYAVCKLLASKNITSVIWLEDLLALHGSKTAVWDLHLLVEDTMRQQRFFSITDTKKQGQTAVSKTIQNLDYDDRLRFALYIGCLIGYCYYLQDSDGQLVKTHVYAENLKPEHREVHYDITFESPNKKSFTTTNRHTYHVRRSREIREGAFLPKPYEEGAFRTNLTTVSEQE